MKIFHVISSGGMYGAEAVILNLCVTLGEMGHVGEIVIFQNEHRPNLELAEAAEKRGIVAYPLVCRGKFDRGAMRRLRELIQRENVDVVHAHGYKSDIYTYFAAKGAGVGMVSTCHNWLDSDLNAWAYGVMDRMVLRQFQRVVGVSEAVLERLRSAGVKDERCRLIENGISVRPFANAEPTLRREFGFNGELIGVVGRLSPEKGITYLLDAAGEVLEKRPSAMFVIVGDGPERSSLEAAAQTLGLGERVRFTGKRSDVPGVFASLDVLVQPSVDEGLPITLLEALASRLPVVATNVGAVPKVIENEKTGLLVEPRNARAIGAAILRLLEWADLRQRIADAGYEHVLRQFSAQRMTRDYLEVYESALLIVDFATAEE